MSQRAPYRRTNQAPPGPPLSETEADLVETHRDRVRDLEARSYLPSQIAAITRLPMKIIDKILTTKAPPKRGPK